MPPQILRSYQQKALANIFAAWRSGSRSVLAVSPTGSGKTTILGELTRAVSVSGSPVLVLAHRRELVEQAATRLREFGVKHGVIMADVQPSPYLPVQVASKDSLLPRLRASAFLRAWAAKVRLLIIDEAHLSTAQSYQAVLEFFPNAPILGVTATPWRLAGKPLAGAYDACVVVATPAELRGQGFLSDYVGFSYLAPDVSKLKTTGGDYNERQSADAMSEGVIVDNIVEQWQAHASTLSTVVFAVTVEHSRQLAERFRAVGVSCEHLDGGTAVEARRGILARVASGQTRVLCNVGIAVEGLDIPRLKCCVLARPTKSLARAIQMMGRVRRPWNGVVARIHDHAFNIRTHGLPDAERDYSLTAAPEAPPSLKTCRKCRAVFPPGRACQECGDASEPDPMGERVLQTVSGDEVEQVGFTSEMQTLDGRTAPPTLPARPPVKVQWDTIGKEIEGIFRRQWEEPSPWGNGTQRHYLFEGETRNYDLPGTAQLDRYMRKVPINTRAKVTLIGDSPYKDGKRRKEFKVEVDDNTVAMQNNAVVKTEPPDLRRFVETWCVRAKGLQTPLNKMIETWRRKCPNADVTQLAGIGGLFPEVRLDRKDVYHGIGLSIASLDIV